LQNEQTLVDGIALRCSLASMYHLTGILPDEETLEDRSSLWERALLPSADSRDEDEMEEIAAAFIEGLETRKGLALRTAFGLPPYAWVGAMLFMLYENNIEKGQIIRKDREPLEVRLTEKGRRRIQKAGDGTIFSAIAPNSAALCPRCPWFDWCRPEEEEPVEDLP